MREIIQSQVELLADLNRELASQTTPEAAREIRENVKLLLELAGAQVDQAGVRALEDLEARLEALEDVLFGLEDFDMGNAGNLVQFIQDCREDLDGIYDNWGPALDRNLGEDWCEEVSE
jgi:hypothetical protein